MLTITVKCDAHGCREKQLLGWNPTDAMSTVQKRAEAEGWGFSERTATCPKCLGRWDEPHRKGPTFNAALRVVAKKYHGSRLSLSQVATLVVEAGWRTRAFSLYTSVSNALHTLFKTTPEPGWISREQDPSGHRTTYIMLGDNKAEGDA